MKLLLCVINYAVTDGPTVVNKHRLEWPAQGFPGLSAKHMASHLPEVLALFLCSPTLPSDDAFPSVHAPRAPL